MENQPASPRQAPTGVILKVEHRPHTVKGEINTHIILKGHPLPTPHRDESLHHTIAPELTWNSQSCIYCQQCQLACPRGCLHQSDDGLVIDRNTCTACGTCVKECPSMSLEVAGTKTTAADLLHKTFKQHYTIARKIKHVTIGGGEPGLQTAFCADLLFQLSAMGVPTTLQTTGAVPYERYLPLIALPAIIQYELITIDPVLHQQITGYENATILENLTRFSHEKAPATQMVIRTPLLPGKNTARESLQEIGTWLKAQYPSPPTWELFEPRSACDEANLLSVEDFNAIYTDMILHYPAYLVHLTNWKGQTIPVGPDIIHPQNA